MTDDDGTTRKLIQELEQLRARVAVLEQVAAERKHVEEALAESEDRFRAIFEAARDPIFIKDRALRYIQVNPAMEELFGLPASRLIGQTDIDLFGEARGACVQEIDARVLKGEVIEEEQARPIEGEGQVFHVVKVPIRDGSGEIIGLCGIARDITERVQAEDALRESEERYRLIAKNALDIIWMTDLDLRITYISPAVSRIMGYSVEEALAQTPEEILTPESLERTKQVLIEELAREREGINDPHRSRTLELELKCKDGSTTWSEIQLSLLRDTDGRVTGILGVGRDITERKQLEEERERLIEDLNSFAHTVAHNLKNPVNNIVGFANVLRDGHASDNGHKPVEFILESGLRINNIIHELLILAGVSKMEAEINPVNMEQVVERAYKCLAYMIDDYQAEIVFPTEWPVALGHAPWVEEVWINYISNAVKYGGRPPHIELGATEQADGMVRFWVRDNGYGIAPEDRARLFAPFTRFSQVKTEGHGLGLSIVQRIVEKLGGEVGIASEVGKGSTFYFTLPGATD